MSLVIVILAAGQGTRMCSKLPKVLHPLAGRPLLSHLLERARQLQPSKLIVVYGHAGDQLREYYADCEDIIWVEQCTFKGTGDAMRYVLPHLRDDDHVLVLYGDTPLVDTQTLNKLVDTTTQDLFWLTVTLDNPAQYGRILRDSAGQMRAIREAKDANAQELQIQEINSGIFTAPAHFLKSSLPQLTTKNAQQELYLTDIVEIAYQQNYPIHTIAGDANNVRGVNTREQLAELEALYQSQQRQQLMRNGVTLIEPHSVDIRGSLATGIDIIIDKNVIFEGEVILGDNIKIGANCIIKNARIEEGTEVLPFTMIDGATIESHCQIGPFARIRPQSILKTAAKVGNFVEIKHTVIGQNSKVNHLSYIGDTTMGERINVGAGTITCNYDGVNKWQTHIADDVFIGSNTALVAPVTLASYTTIGAGSVITNDIPHNTLAFTRAPLILKKDWQRPQKIAKSMPKPLTDPL